jgi:hypothetical protein
VIERERETVVAGIEIPDKAAIDEEDARMDERKPRSSMTVMRGAKDEEEARRGIGPIVSSQQDSTLTVDDSHGLVARFQSSTSISILIQPSLLRILI